MDGEVPRSGILLDLSTEGALGPDVAGSFERCADEGKRWSALSVASKSVAVRPQDQHVVRPHYEWARPVPGPSPREPDRPASRAEVNSPFSDNFEHSLHPRQCANRALCVQERRPDALANDLGEHGDSMV
jgi:hypothetical protein